MPEESRIEYSCEARGEYDREVARSIQSLFDLTTRIDERAEQMIAAQTATAVKLEAEIERLRELVTRVSVLEKTTNQSEEVERLVQKVHDLELRMQSSEINSGNVEGRWRVMVNFGLQLAWVIIAAYLLYKLGIQAPAVP